VVLSKLLELLQPVMCCLVLQKIHFWQGFGVCDPLKERNSFVLESKSKKNMPEWEDKKKKQLGGEWNYEEQIIQEAIDIFINGKHGITYI